MVRLRLYIAGQTRPSVTALSTVQKLQDSMRGTVEVEVVDVLEEPDIAEEARVLATPTLDRVEPWPTRRIIGDLGDLDRITDTFELSIDPDDGVATADSDGVAVDEGGAVSITSEPTVRLSPEEIPG